MLTMTISTMYEVYYVPKIPLDSLYPYLIFPHTMLLDRKKYSYFTEEETEIVKEHLTQGHMNGVWQNQSSIQDHSDSRTQLVSKTLEEVHNSQEMEAT